MSEPFLSEIKIASFNFPPTGWAFCDGQLLPINQNQALYALLGTTFGGDGRTNFALPDFRGRVPVHEGNGVSLGEEGGAETATLGVNELPSHTHALHGSDGEADTPLPGDAMPGNVPTQAYRDLTSPAQMADASVRTAGGGKPHNNMQPYLALNFIIALQGIFPSQN